MAHLSITFMHVVLFTWRHFTLMDYYFSSIGKDSYCLPLSIVMYSCTKSDTLIETSFLINTYLMVPRAILVSLKALAR